MMEADVPQVRVHCGSRSSFTPIAPEAGFFGSTVPLAGISHSGPNSAWCLQTQSLEPKIIKQWLAAPQDEIAAAMRYAATHLHVVVEGGGAVGLAAWLASDRPGHTLPDGPVVIVISLIFRRNAQRAYRAVRGKLALQNAYTAELIGGVRTTRAFAQDARWEPDLDRESGCIRAVAHAYSV